MSRIVVVTNEPPPYRVPVFNMIANTLGARFHVIFCCRREPNRQWNLPPMNFDRTFLRERILTVNKRYIHNNPDVIPGLRRFAPDVIVTDGFNPTQIYAFGYAWMKGLPHIPMTDGTYLSEQTLSVVHRMVRRFVYARSAAFIAASRGGQRLYESYGIAARRCFRSCLAIDNDVFFQGASSQEKRFDFIFSGRIEAVKNPVFALNVARETARRVRRKTKLLFVGAGSEEGNVRSAASRMADLVETEFHGFAMQQALPSLYGSARLLLFPTLWDPWGVVANEACAAGLPVIVSPNAGVAGELILNNENGFLCELDVNLWAERAVQLLTQPDLYQKFSERSRSMASDYTFDHAAAGILEACRFALSDRMKSPSVGA